jgi:hypothetical protein
MQSVSNIRIKLNIEELMLRTQQVKQLLVPISKYATGPTVDIKPSSTVCIIGTHDGANSSSDYLTWFFSTKASELKAQYYEHWHRLDDKGKVWYLERAYLNIHRSDSKDNRKKEFVCLHCDPSFAPDVDPDEDKMGYEKQKKQQTYKCLPHIHIGYAMPKAHIALHVGNEDRVHASVPSLFEAMKLAIIMIKDEIFDEPERWRLPI